MQPISIYVTRVEFEKDLNDGLTIIRYPNRSRKYYVCSYKKSIVYIHIKN